MARGLQGRSRCPDGHRSRGQRKHSGKRTKAFVPPQHWSMRVPWEFGTSLWGGWAVKSPDRSFWFTGDTGYCALFYLHTIHLAAFPALIHLLLTPSRD